LEENDILPVNCILAKTNKNWANEKAVNNFLIFSYFNKILNLQMNGLPD